MDNTNVIQQDLTGTMDKKAYAQVLVWLWRLIEYGPIVYKVVKKIYDYLQSKSPSPAPQTAEVPKAAAFEDTKNQVFDVLSNVVNVIERIINSGHEILNSDMADLVVDLLGIFGLKPEDIGQLKEKLDQVLVAIQDFIETIKSGLPEPTAEEGGMETIASSDIDRVVEADFVQINSGLYSIKKGSAYYNDIESLMEKVAFVNCIEDVEAIEINISKEGMSATFKRDKEAEFNALSAIVTGIADRYIGQNDPNTKSSWGETGLKVVGGAVTNMGFPIGMSIAKYFGAGTLGQLAAGGLGALAWHLFVSGDSEQGKQAQAEAYQQSMADPDTSALVDLISEKTGQTKDQVWKYLLQNMAKSKTS